MEFLNKRKSGMLSWSMYLHAVDLNCEVADRRAIYASYPN